MKKLIMNPVSMAVLGFLSGGIFRFIDYSNPMLEGFSERIMLWMTACVVITLCADHPLQSAVLNICFFVPVLPAHYLVWRLLADEYGGYMPTPKDLLVGMLIYLVIIPPYAMLVGRSRCSGFVPWIMRPLIIILPMAATLIFYGLPNVTDLISAGIMAYVIFIRKLGRYYNPV